MYVLVRIFGGLFIVAFIAAGVGCGGLTVYGGTQALAEASTLADRGRETTGKVLDTRTVTSTDSDGHTSTRREILVEFLVPAAASPPYDAADATPRQFWASGDEEVGHQVTVLYDPENPDLAVTDGSIGHRVGGIFLIVIGVGIMLIFGIGPIWWWISERYL